MRRRIQNQNIENKKRESVLHLIGQLVVNVVALLVVEAVVPGFTLIDIKTAVITAIVLGVVNTFIRPVLQLIALPISLLTLGLTAFLINVALLLLVDKLIDGFEIDSFVIAAIASIVLSLVTAFLHKLAKTD